jgi:hypothetical protein
MAGSLTAWIVCVSEMTNGAGKVNIYPNLELFVETTR